jgi:hypothetical protein
MNLPVVVAAAWWEVVGAVAAAVGALAAAAGAGAAWRAASASAATSRDALEALAVGIRPRVRITWRQLPRRPGDPMPCPTRLFVRVVAVGEWPATDVDLEAVLSDGEHVRDHLEQLDAGGDFMGDRDPQWLVPLRDVTAEWPAAMGGGIDWPEQLSVTVRYSDARGVARYEHRQHADLRGGGVNLAVSTNSAIPTERRLR